MATGLGVDLALAPLAALCSLGIFIVVLAITRYVSLASILAAFMMPVFCLLWMPDRSPVFVGGVIFLALLVRHFENNVYVQIGLIMLIGLSAKNAILIVEFAKQQEEEGKERISAVLEACRLRLRPILMTSFAFILGVLPLVLSSGAGSGR